MTDSQSARTTTEKPCFECGAPLVFQPGVGKMKCQFCGTENEIKDAGLQTSPWGEKTGTGPEVREIDYQEALAGLMDGAEIEETATLRCPGCGAEVSLGADTLADACPFCATPLARTEVHAHRHPKPQGVLPFAFDEREARGNMKKWLGKLWFAPNALKKYAEAGRPLSGVYLPHYTYDAVGDASYRGQRGDAYYVTRTRTVNGKSQTYQERKVRWSNVSGHVRHVFDDVLVPASETMNPSRGRAEYGGGSWDLAAMEPYRTDFLAGFRAEAPAIAIDAGFTHANRVMEDTLKRDIRFDIGGDEQRISHMDSRYSNITFKHVLLPVWLASYRFNNKPYRVVINGRTGRVTGERPFSVWKIAFAVLLLIVLAAGVGYLAATNQ